jgi:hypothetical protein
MKKVVGWYNEYLYTVDLDSQEIYRAGNSPLDSQAYVSDEDGVGVDRMREFCTTTSKDLAKEHHAKFVGVQYLEQE